MPDISITGTENQRVKNLTTEIKQHLLEISDNQYADFSNSLIPNTENILGVRMPKLRVYAKELAKNPAVLDSGDDIYYEEILLRGLIIGYMKTDIETKLKYMSEFIPQINNWAVCDSFCSTLKFTNKNREHVWEFLQPYAHSDKEFEQRFCAVMLLDYFVNEEYISRTLSLLTQINTDQYYSSMAAAWALAECYIKFPQKTQPFIYGNFFDTATLKRSVRKICDSYRVDDNTKLYLKREIFRHDKGNG